MYYILDEVFMESVTGHTAYLILSDAVKAAKAYSKEKNRGVMIVKEIKVVKV